MKQSPVISVTLRRSRPETREERRRRKLLELADLVMNIAMAAVCVAILALGALMVVGTCV